MRKEDFLRDLKRKLPDDKYKNRFLEELDEHIEDALSDREWKSKVPEESVLKRLGSPHFIYIYYQVIMHNKRWYLYAEIFFWSLISLLVYTPTLASTALIDEPENLFIKAVIWTLSLTGSVGLYYLFYTFAYSRLKKLHAFQESMQRLLLNMTGYFIPMIFFIGWMAGAYFLIDADKRQDLFYAPMGLINLLLGFATAYHVSKQSQSSPWIERIGALFILVFFSLFLIYPIAPMVLRKLFFLPMVLLGEVKTYWLLGLLFMGLFLYSTYDLVRYLRNRKSTPTPWIQGIIFLYMLFIFFVPHGTEDPIMGTTPIWEVEAHNITDDLEGLQIQPFFNMIQYITDSRDGLRGFEYQIELRGESFVLRQDGIEPKEWNIININAVTAYELTSIDPDPRPVLEGDYTLPSSIACVQADYEQELREQEGLADMPLVLGGETHCTEFYYKDQLLFSSTETVFVSNVLVSPNEEWMLLNVAYSDVYLVELK